MPDPDDLKFLRQAIRLGHKYSHSRVGGPFGAIVRHDGRIIGRGWNKVTSSFDPTAHAEMVAIRAACRASRAFHLAGAQLYTSCEPCPMCLAAAYWARLDRIVYAATRKDAAAIGFDDDRLYKELALPHAKRRIPTKQLLRRESLLVMRQWHAMPGKVVY
ncbi:MAG: nucleoside deaminase [Verrucomicrobiales bacterium]